MPVTKETFESGLTADQYIDLVEANREKFLENLEADGITDEDKQFFKEHPVHVAAIGEDWCTDVVQFLPVIINLAKQVPEVELRVFQRDKTELINDYLNQGLHKSIPVFVVLDQDWNELGHFIERPAAVTKLMGDETRRFAQDNPQLEGANRSYENMPDETRLAVRANSSAFRWNSMAEWNRIFLDEIKSIVAGNRAAV